MRAATDLVALAGEHVALRRQGRRWVGRCPFHDDRTPSFSVNAEEGLYYCFGCQASGDAITFVRAVEHLDFVPAVERLADRAGIPLTPADGAEAERHSRRSRLLEAMEAAVAWYHQRLLTHEDAGPARDYLRSRGYDGATVRRFQLGWAPDGWDVLAQALKLPGDLLAESGLGFVNRLGRRQDAFRARIIFPIFDPGGRAVGLGGRILPPGPGRAGAPLVAAGAAPAAGVAPAPEAGQAPAEGPGIRGPTGPLRTGRAGWAEPKYKNSQETAIYAKRRVLYGLNWAKTDVVATGEVVVCEGYTDVIGLFQAGVPRAVATCGTALAEEHFKLLRNFARRVVLAYDADSAGQAAAERFYEWERRHDLDIAVADLPGGTDPAELARGHPEALREAIGAARSFLAFRVGRVLEGSDLSTVEGRAKGAEAALAAVAEHPSPLVRDQYVMEVASRCRADPDQVRSLLTRLLRRPGGGPPAPHPAPPGRQPGISGPTAAGRPGLEGLRLAVHRPAEVADRLEEVLFEDPVQRAAFRALAASATLHQAITEAEPEVAGLLTRLAVEQTEVDADDVIRQLVRASAERALTELQAGARAGEESFAELAARVAWLRLGIEALTDPQASPDVTASLLTWLVEWAEERR